VSRCKSPASPTPCDLCMFRFTIMFVWCFMMGNPHLGKGHSKNVTQDSLLPCPRPLILRMITPWGSNLHITTFFLHLCTCFLQHQIAPMSLQFVLPFIGKDGFLQLSPREARLLQSWILYGGNYNGFIS
jgi:hypothetical protein